MPFSGFISSHPAWVCGLKQIGGIRDDAVYESHPAWVCGLKLKNDHNGARVRDVTPCVGVWIETYYPLIVAYYTGVTPCVGVWIET